MVRIKNEDIIPVCPLEESPTMTRQRAGSIIAAFASVGLIATAALHSTGYNSVAQLALQAPTELHALVPALWLAFALDLAVVGLIVGVVAFRPTTSGRLILVIAAVSPLGAAGLQLWFLGFIPPTGILLGVGGLALLAAGVLPRGVGQRPPAVGP